MEKSISLLNNIRSQCYSEILYYQDNRSVSKIYSIRYISGRIDASIWINELIEEFLRFEMIKLQDFLKYICDKKLLINIINNDYNQGLYDQIEEMEKKIDARINLS